MLQKFICKHSQCWKRDYYFETILNSSTSPCNNSPTLVSSPIPYVCINQTVNYNLGVFEPDGDSLVFSLVSALADPGVPVPYQGGYSGASPINGINIDPSTGEITFTPTILGNFVVVVLIEEFDDSGNLKGSFLHDFQFEVVFCSNITPSPPSTGISNFSGGAVVTGNNNIQACEGDSICFDLVFTDNNSTDSIYISSNVDQFFPGATVSQNSFFSPVTASVCLLVGANSNAFNTIVIDAVDNACPISGISSAAVGITVIHSAYAGLDAEICLGDSVQLNTSGGSTFNWSVISGDPISIVIIFPVIIVMTLLFLPMSIQLINFPQIFLIIVVQLIPLQYMLALTLILVYLNLIPLHVLIPM